MKIIFLAGLPGVGKSTLARRVAKKLSGMVLDIDPFKKLVVDPVSVVSTIDPPDIRWKYYTLAIEEIFHLFKQGQHTIVVDEVFHLHCLRERLENLCVERGAKVSWLEIRCPYEVVKERLQKQHRAGHILSTENALDMYLRFKEIFQPFSVDKENYAIVDNDGLGDASILIR